mmetsp:Transcript_1660/g.4040  ORF Transcript_1660/g.4040 Transcript_1660/m.4040 type:complete len:82 (+) Transcript_1660:2-247(+)
MAPPPAMPAEPEKKGWDATSTPTAATGAIEAQLAAGKAKKESPAEPAAKDESTSEPAKPARKQPKRSGLLPSAIAMKKSSK